MKTFILTFSLLCCASFVHAQPAFTDVTSAAGVANAPAGERLGNSLAWGDYDNDGDLDLYVVNWGQNISEVLSTNRLYRNNGNGTFTDVALSADVADDLNGTAAHWVDYDNDGDLDLYLVLFDRQDRLFRNNGSGAFTDVTGASGVNPISQGSENAAAWGDYDGDGDLDLYTCKYYFRNSFLINNGNGTFFENAVGAGVADVRDSEHAAWGDYDGDGDLDLYVVNREQNNALYRNDNGSFSEVACALSLDNTDVGRRARWVDYDTDGDLDLFLANIGANALYRNDGNARFVNIADGDLKSIVGAWISWDGAWGDYDADGDPDLFVANGAESNAGQASPLLQNNGNDTFSNVTAAARLSTSVGIAVAAGAADYDGDGDLDLYVVHGRFLRAPSQLYRNDTPNTSTVKVKVRRRNAADGIGARVRLLTAGQLRGHQILAADAGAQEAVFGVQPGVTYSVEVVFPGGATATRSNVSAGATVEIRQP